MTVKVTKGLPKAHRPTSCHLSLVLRSKSVNVAVSFLNSLTIHKCSNFQSNTTYIYCGFGRYYDPYLDHHQLLYKTYNQRQNTHKNTKLFREIS
jgi:hypothetical protein